MSSYRRFLYQTNQFFFSKYSLNIEKYRNLIMFYKVSTKFRILFVLKENTFLKELYIINFKTPTKLTII